MTTERTPFRARRRGRANSHPLRYFSAPGIRAWSALPTRDQALLRWLLQGSVVTSDLAALLAYGHVRTARRRLSRLVADGLIRGYWAANAQRPRGRYAYSLLGPVRDALAERLGLAASRRGAPAATTGTIHQLATHDLLGALLRVDPPDRCGLAAWLPERSLWHLFSEYLRPDALAVLAVPGGRVTLFVERDLGTEPTRVLLAKAQRYRTVLARAPGSTANLGIVVNTSRRAGWLLSHLGPAASAARPHLWVGMAPELLADPYHARWRNLAGEMRTTIDLPSDPGQPERFIGRLCLLDPDGLEAFEPSTSSTPMLEPFLRGAGR